MRKLHILYLFGVMSLLFGGVSAAETAATQPLFNPSSPKHEVRAVWLATIGGIDWPKKKSDGTEQSIAAQKRELCNMLDKLQHAHINTVLLQTRIRGSVIYPSKIEPWDIAMTGYAGKNPGYDPLAFAIEECHKRGMEIHAWVVSIPLGTVDRQKAHKGESIIQRRPNLCKTVGKECFMMPAAEGTADYIASICGEIAANYDVDGISLDYIRYPEAVYKYDDSPVLTTSKRGASAKKNAKTVMNAMDLADWRRQNITRIVKRVHDVVKPIKPWVKLSSSPIGKYRDLRHYSSRGWNCYDAVSQAPQEWLRDGLQDMLFPMMYFQGDNFYPFVMDWQQNSYGKPVVPGLGIYFLDPREGKWQIGDVLQEMHVVRQSGIGGIAFYRSEFFTRNCQGLYDATMAELYQSPALCPPLAPYPSQIEAVSDWRASSATDLAVRYDNDMLVWNELSTNTGSYTLYNIYASNTSPVDCSDANNLIRTRLRSTRLPLDAHTRKYLNYAVTAMDRYGRESAPSQLSIGGDPYRPALTREELRKLVVRPEVKGKAKSKKKRKR